MNRFDVAKCFNSLRTDGDLGRETEIAKKN
jgi:hypothetical protein